MLKQAVRLNQGADEVKLSEYQELISLYLRDLTPRVNKHALDAGGQ
jgi:hypothetical protein